MLKRLYDKSKILFSVLWIVAYCVLMSAGDALSALAGAEKSVTLPVAIALSVALAVFLRRHSLLRKYGISKPQANPGSMLYYLPAVALVSANLWFGVRINFGAAETVLYVLTMLLVGLLEELVFRGLLFEAMREDSPAAAVVVSSLTFGIGHIINFLGGGAELVPTLMQVVYATAAGFMFVMMYLRSGSLVGCILIHGVFNALSAFGAEPTDLAAQILSSALITLISGGYGAYLLLSMRGKCKEQLSKCRENK